MKTHFALTLLLVLAAPILAQPGLATQTTLEERNKALVRRLYDEVFAQGKLEVADEIFAPHYVMHEVSSGWWDAGRPADLQASPANIKSLTERLRRTFPDLRFSLDLVMAEKDFVVVRWSVDGTPAGVFRLLAFGQAFHGSGVNIYRIADGKVVENWNHRDDLGAQQQLGLMRLKLASGFLAGVLLCGLVWLIVRLRRKASGRRLAVA